MHLIIQNLKFKAGAISGLVVESVLFPLDTLKTRQQSIQGLHASGSFRSLYSGFPAVIIGSAPGAALFFVTYESVKRSFKYLFPNHDNNPLCFVTAATLGEIAACSIRVPAEVLKQRMQVMKYRVGIIVSAKELFRHEGTLGFYRGFQATLQREIPFAWLQYPMYELFKLSWSNTQGKNVPLDPWKGALCGSVAGGLTGFLTTPLDVIKTRTILADKMGTHLSSNPLEAMKELMKEGGTRKLFAGAFPRTAWISLGGFLFFGAYEKSTDLLQRWTSRPTIA